MNRQEYLHRLRISLQFLPIAELEDILSDYKEHFHIGISKGKSEEEISKELGDPSEVANGYKSTFKPNINKNANYSNDNTNKLLIALLLIGFNVVVVLGFFLGLVGLLIGSYAIGFALIVAGIIVLFGFPIALITNIFTPHILTSLSFGFGTIGLGVLGIILSVYLTKGFYKLTVKYIQWNIELINKGGAFN